MRSQGDAYRGFASIYDATMGDAAFPTVWEAFERARRKHAIFFASACDVGCGTGLFLKQLSRDRVRLTGVDNSAAMLRRAAQRLAGTRVRLLRQDMRKLRLPEPVELITSNFCTLNYCDNEAELVATFGSLRSNLSPNGHLLADLLIDLGPLAREESMVQKIDSPVMRSRWRISLPADGKGSVVEMHTRVRNSDGREEYEWRERHRQRWFALPLLLNLLERSGFEVMGVRRMPSDAPSAQTNRWMHLVARAS
jgi:SAM-dependent methyltransferase